MSVCRYVQGITVLALVGLVIGFGCLLVGICWFMCLCCGDEKSKRGLVFTNAQKLWPKIVLFLVMVLVVVGGALCYVGSNKFTDSVPRFTNQLVTAGNSQSARAVNNAQALLELNVTGRAAVQAYLLVESAKETATYANESKNDAEIMDSKRKLYLGFSCAVALSAMGLGLIAALFHSKWMAFLTVAVCFIGLWLNWSSFGLHYAGSVLVADFCLELKNFTAVNTSVSDELTPPFVRCLPFSNLDRIVSSSSYSLESSLKLVSASYPATRFPARTTYPESGVLGSINTTLVDLRASSATARTDKNITDSLKWVFALSEVLVLHDCRDIKEAFLSIRSEYCYDWIMTLRQITGGNGLIAFMLFFGTYAAVLGTTRFAKPPKSVDVTSKGGKAPPKHRDAVAMVGAAGAGGAVAVHHHQRQHHTELQETETNNGEEEQEERGERESRNPPAPLPPLKPAKGSMA